MSTDKRSVTTDALDTLGFIISEKEKRDAIHLAVEPVKAGQLLVPGDHVILMEDGRALKTKIGKGVGIVDPFLLEEVEAGQIFWLVVYPRQITSLRHVWEHPLFPKSKEIEEKPKESAAVNRAREVLECIALDLNVDYDELIEAANEHYISGEYWTQGANFEGESIPENFWPNWAIVTGQPYKDLGNFLNCSC